MISYRRPALWIAAAALGVAFLPVLTRSYAKEETPKPAPAALRSANDLSAAFEFAADRVQQSVVSINSVVHAQPTRGRGENPLRGTPFEHLFNERFGGGNFDFQPMPRMGLGSGFVLDHDGHIVTNNHVVQGADKVTVTVGGERQLEAKVIGTDPKTDLAVLKVDAEGLVPLELGSSDEMRLGQWVLACGNPFGLNATITAGIVSAKGRSGVGLADYEDFIQTDAAINPGNSGGPLVDLEGNVIGINSAIFTRTGGSMGIGFAIPIDLARPILESLVHDGSVTRGWLGVAIQDLTPGLRKDYDFEGDGVLVGEVTAGGPAEEAGLEAEDIVTKIGGKAVRDRNQLRNVIAALHPGKDVDFELVRDGESHTVTVEIGAQPKDFESRPVPALSRSGGGLHEKLGFTVRDVTRELASEYGIDEGQRGALVVEVDPGSAAEAAGLVAGDVIVRVGKDPVEDARELGKELSARDLKDGVRLIVRNSTGQRIVFIELDR